MAQPGTWNPGLSNKADDTRKSIILNLSRAPGLVLEASDKEADEEEGEAGLRLGEGSETGCT